MGTIILVDTEDMRRGIGRAKRIFKAAKYYA